MVSRGYACGVALATIVLALCVVACDHKEAPARQLLSVEETVATTTLPTGFEGETPWNAYSRGNPAAAPALREIVKDRQRVRQHAAAWIILGYVGSVEDVQLFEDAVLHNYHGLLRGADARAVCALFEGLGLMARRGITEAEALLKEMARWQYWEAVDFQWLADEIVNKDARLSRHDTTLLRVLLAFALTEKEQEQRRLSQAILDEVGDVKRDYLKWLLDPDRLLRHARSIREKEMESLPPFDMRRIQSAAGIESRLPEAGRGGVAETLQGSLAKEDAAVVQGIIGEARAAFEDITTRALEGAYDAVFPRLLDGGQLLQPKKVSALRSELERDLRDTCELLQELKKQQTTWGKCVVSQSVMWQCSDLDGAQLLGTKSETIEVEAELTNTTDLGRRVGQAGRSRSPFIVAEDGSLIVVMKKLDGQWYWNPFGW